MVSENYVAHRPTYVFVRVTLAVRLSGIQRSGRFSTIPHRLRNREEVAAHASLVNTLGIIDESVNRAESSVVTGFSIVDSAIQPSEPDSEQLLKMVELASECEIRKFAAPELNRRI